MRSRLATSFSCCGVASMSLRVGIVFTALAPVGYADHIVVKRRVTLRSAPTASSELMIQVEPGQAFALAAQGQVNRFYPVVIDSNETAWVYRGFVELVPGDPPADARTELRSLEVHVLDVGQGDAVLIRCPDGEHQLLIDSGDTRYPGSAAAFRSRMEALQRREDPIEIVITTHPHADHMGSVEWLLPNFTISRYVDAGKTNTSKLFKRVENALDGSLVPRDRVVDGVPDIDFCPRQDVSARVLRAEGFGSPHDLNDCSVVVRVDYGATSFLFVGDAEAEQEEQLLKEPATRALLDCDFLKVGHHGSDTSSGEEFIGAVSPRVVAISCGEPGVGTNAGYRHPRASTVKRLMRHADARPTAESLPAYDAAAREWVVLEVGSEVYSTSTRRDLVFTSDGARITLRED